MTKKFNPKLDEELIKIIECAYSLLNNDKKMMEIPYLYNKKHLQQLFNDKVQQPFNDKGICLETRLTILNKLYSTRSSIKGTMNIINEHGTKKLVEKMMEGDIDNLTYPITKKGTQEDVKPISLLSKYLYYETNFEFPIYDSLAKATYSEFFGFNKTIKPKEYFSKIKQIKEKNSLTYDKIDAFGWVHGKLSPKDENGESASYITGLGKRDYYKKLEEKIAEYKRDYYKKLEEKIAEYKKPPQ